MSFPDFSGDSPWPRMGAGRSFAKQKAEQEAITEQAEWDALEKEQAKNATEADAKTQAEEEVVISRLAWGMDEGRINEPIRVSANAKIPTSMEHLTRFSFTLFSETEGRRDRIDGKEVYWKDGVVSAEFTLYQPSRGQPAELGKYRYIFTVKHRNSREVESIALLAVLEYDEQFQLLDATSSMPLVDFPYYVEAKGRKLAAGRTDSEGKTPRISTNQKRETLSVYWGDSALAKENS